LKVNNDVNDDACDYVGATNDISNDANDYVSANDDENDR